VKTDASQLTAFVNAAHRAANLHGLVRCSSGNLSWRVGNGRMLVTATRSCFGTLRRDQVALVRIGDGAPLNKVKPSVEAGFHAGVLRERRDMNVVLHFQTPFATTVSCRRDVEKLSFFVTPEIPYYIGAVAVVPYRMPGTKELADAVTAALKGHDMVILRNHGLATVGVDFDDAIQKAVFFELACQIVVQAGDKLELIPRQGVETLLRKPGQV
jgi:ribulose-5-phosphate 4-epimerase/fuculose-1-phosphate aldolase